MYIAKYATEIPLFRRREYEPNFKTVIEQFSLEILIQGCEDLLDLILIV